MKTLTVFGTRPEIIKLSPLIPLLDRKFWNIVVYTGQHVSPEMKDVFFRDLHVREPDYDLAEGSGKSDYSLGCMILGLARIIDKEGPDAVVIYGDTNTTLAGALAAKASGVGLIHIEAGCRSGNAEMPEEVNRILADRCSDILLATDEIARQNLLQEGIEEPRIFVSGSSLPEAVARMKRLSHGSGSIPVKGMRKGRYAVATLHRAENISKERLKEMIGALSDLSKETPVIFPVHPRTMKAIDSWNIRAGPEVKMTAPMDYPSFIKLVSGSRFVLTDSGGVQEESVLLDVPCIVMRSETEYQRFISMGKIVLAGTGAKGIVSAARSILSSPSKKIGKAYRPPASACRKMIDIISSHGDLLKK